MSTLKPLKPKKGAFNHLSQIFTSSRGSPAAPLALSWGIQAKPNRCAIDAFEEVRAQGAKKGLSDGAKEMFLIVSDPSDIDAIPFVGVLVATLSSTCKVTARADVALRIAVPSAADNDPVLNRLIVVRVAECVLDIAPQDDKGCFAIPSHAALPLYVAGVKFGVDEMIAKEPPQRAVNGTMALPDKFVWNDEQFQRDWSA